MGITLTCSSVASLLAVDSDNCSRFVVPVLVDGDEFVAVVDGGDDGTCFVVAQPSSLPVLGSTRHLEE